MAASPRDAHRFCQRVNVTNRYEQPTYSVPSDRLQVGVAMVTKGLYTSAPSTGHAELVPIGAGPGAA